MIDTEKLKALVSNALEMLEQHDNEMLKEELNEALSVLNDEYIPFKVTDHPYYPAEGNYFAKKGQASENYDSWEDFDNDFFVETLDTDWNWIYRWDIVENNRITEIKDDELILILCFAQQRKSKHISCNIVINEDDMPAINKLLLRNKRYTERMWT